MIVIKPIPITDAVFVSSTVAEPAAGETAWSAGTTYAAGDEVILASTHMRYLSLQNANTGNNPATATAWWKETVPTNRWGAFDDTLGTNTSGASPLTIILTPGAIDSVSLHDLAGAESAQIVYKDSTGGTTVYDETFSLDSAGIYCFYDWFFEDYRLLDRLTVRDIPPSYPSGELTVTLTGAGTVSCGALVAGRQTDLGGTLYGVQAGIADYSKKTTDEYGRTSFVQGRWAREISAKILLMRDELSAVYTRLVDLRTTPCVWVTSEVDTDRDLVVFGIYKDFTVDVAYPTVLYCTLEIEGLT